MDQTCAKCGAELPDGAKFCLACGSRVVFEPGKTRFCMHCGTALPAGAKFCLQCGGAADIPAAASPAIAVSGAANPPQEAPATVKPEEVPAEARTADMIQYYYRRSKAIRNVVLSIPILIYFILFFSDIDSYLWDIRAYIESNSIHDGFVVTLIALMLIVPYWIISEAVIRTRRRNAICEAGMDSIQFKAALQKYKSMKMEGKLRPEADPGPIPDDLTAAVAIRSRYRERSAAAQVVLIAIWLLFFLIPTVFLPEQVEAFYDDHGMVIFLLVILYTIGHFAIIIPLLRRRREKQCRKAGFDGKRLLEILYQYKTLKSEKRQWAAQESARKQREEAQLATERLAAAKPAKPGRTTKIWLIVVLIVVISIGGIFMGNIFSGSSSYGAARTLDGLYIDAEGMKNLTLGVNLVYPPDLILFTSGGDVYFSQYEVVHSDAEMKQYGNHYTYKISGNTITINGNTEYTGTINGNTISLVGKTFIPGEY